MGSQGAATGQRVDTMGWQQRWAGALEVGQEAVTRPPGTAGESWGLLHSQLKPPNTEEQVHVRVCWEKSLKPGPIPPRGEA